MPFYQSPFQRRIEIMNECFLVCLCYHFLVFAEVVWTAKFRKIVGTSTIVIVSTLLGINTLIIMSINSKAIKLKCKRRQALKEAKKRASMSDQQRYKADLIKAKAEG